MKRAKGCPQNLWGTLWMSVTDFDREHQGFEGERVCSQTVFRRRNETVQGPEWVERPVRTVGWGWTGPSSYELDRQLLRRGSLSTWDRLGIVLARGRGATGYNQINTRQTSSMRIIP